jgi:hypothetical protein
MKKLLEYGFNPADCSSLRQLYYYKNNEEFKLTDKYAVRDFEDGGYAFSEKALKVFSNKFSANTFENFECIERIFNYLSTKQKTYSSLFFDCLKKFKAFCSENHPGVTVLYLEQNKKEKIYHKLWIDSSAVGYSHASFDDVFKNLKELNSGDVRKALLMTHSDYPEVKECSRFFRLQSAYFFRSCIAQCIFEAAINCRLHNQINDVTIAVIFVNERRYILKRDNCYSPFRISLNTNVEIFV